MAWRLVKSALVGFGAALLAGVVWLAGEDYVVDHFVHPPLPCPAHSLPSNNREPIAVASIETCDEFTYTTFSPFAVLAGFIGGSIVAFRRSRR